MQEKECLEFVNFAELDIFFLIFFATKMKSHSDFLKDNSYVRKNSFNEIQFIGFQFLQYYGSFNVGIHINSIICRIIQV